MTALFDALWRAGAYCLHRRVIVLSILPVLLLGAVTATLGYFYWEHALGAVNHGLDSWELVTLVHDALASAGFPGFKAVLAPILVLSLATPVLVALSLIAVAVFMTPAMVRLIAERRFPDLERKRGGSSWASLMLGLCSTLLASLVLLVSVPLWFIPPLALVLPPLIWGWLIYRVMSYDVLAEHASAQERLELLRRHRPALLVMGVATGFLGGLPSVVWASGLMSVFAPLWLPVAMWVYTLVFAFSSLWFAHYALVALAALRLEVPAPPGAAPSLEWPHAPAENLDSPTPLPPP